MSTYTHFLVETLIALAGPRMVGFGDKDFYELLGRSLELERRLCMYLIARGKKVKVHAPRHRRHAWQQQFAQGRHDIIAFA